MTELTGMCSRWDMRRASTRRLGHRANYAVALAAAFMVAQVTDAHAHLVSTGLGPFYDGFAHVLFAPEDALAVLALALLSGMSGISAGRAVLFTLPVAWCIGALIGLQAPAAPSVPWLTIATFLGLGILIAVNCRLSASAAAGLSITVGFAHGYFNGSVMTAASFDLSMLAGTLASMFFMIAVVAAVVASLRAPWMRIAVRTLGSWIAAGGLLLLGWTLRGGLT
jgi:hydrogenase/urease accessory protein HupE